NWYIPLIFQDVLVGVLAVAPLNQQKFLPDEKGIIIAIAQQIGGYIQKQRLEIKAAQAQRLEESEKLYGLILNCISHELKTPLTSILGNLDLLRQSPKSSEEAIQEVENAALRLRRIIENILDISKLNSGHAALNEEWVDLQEIVTMVTAHLAKIYDISVVSVEIPPEFPYIWGDSVLIERIIENLLVNALQYSPPNAPVRITGEQTESMLTITVRDQGPGIPEAYHSRVFQKFFRVPGSRPGGTGLGLAICKEIMDLHNGTIALNNNAPTGTVVSLGFPHRRKALPLK
ncbi:hypothetical protein EBR96_10995, partial [bacterium]|nr:hypothetical protein [bacterium]